MHRYPPGPLPVRMIMLNIEESRANKPTLGYYCTQVANKLNSGSHREAYEVTEQTEIGTHAEVICKLV
jgi:hypothetical protein